MFSQRHAAGSQPAIAWSIHDRNGAARLT
jgi:hypothetical protein